MANPYAVGWAVVALALLAGAIVFVVRFKRWGRPPAQLVVVRVPAGLRRNYRIVPEGPPPRGVPYLLTPGLLTPEDR